VPPDVGEKLDVVLVVETIVAAVELIVMIGVKLIASDVGNDVEVGKEATTVEAPPGT
jgi:hypothetical protein